jgi:RNA polymerase sigma-70 factor (ECF subfamily)
VGSAHEQAKAVAERLYAERGRELWARLYAACLDPELAMDALHEALLRLTEHWGNGVIQDPASWVVRTGQNWLSDRRKKVSRERNGFDGWSSLPSSASEPPMQAEAAELQASVREALKELELVDREVLVLRYGLGWTSAQIGELLALPPSAVDMRLSRARRRLADLLRDRGVLDES